MKTFKIQSVKGKMILIIIVFSIFLTMTPVWAASAKTVDFDWKKTSNYRVHNKQYVIIKGISESGRLVWKYKTTTCMRTELNSTTALVRGKYVYIIDDNKYIRLKKSNGKVLVKKKLPVHPWSAALKLDSTKNLYVMGYYSDTLLKINPKGKVIWKSRIPSKYYWPNTISLTGKKVKIKFDNGTSYSVNSKNGKK